MTVKTLMEELKKLPDDMKVYIRDPDLYDEEQVAHEVAEVRYTVSDGRVVWFEVYTDEDIEYEVEGVIDYCIEHGVSDADFVRMLIDPDDHGYTWEDLQENLLYGQYEWIRKTAEENGLI